MLSSPQVIPIPGSSKAERVKDNVHAATIQLSDDELKALNSLQSGFEVKGGRYPAMAEPHLMQ